MMPVKTNQPLANETARGDGGGLSVVSLFMLIHPNIAVKTSSCYIYQVNSNDFDWLGIFIPFYCCHQKAKVVE